MTGALIRSAMRGIFAEPVYLIVRVVGLAVGVATACIALAFVRWELGYDSHFTDADRIYRITTDGSTNLRVNPSPLLDGHRHVLRWTRFKEAYLPLLSHGDRRRFTVLDPVGENFLRVLDLPMLEGDRRTALSSPDAVVITEQMRRFYFGDESALGKHLLWDNEHEVVITGVVALPRQTHLEFDVLAPPNAAVIAQANADYLRQFIYSSAVYVVVDDAQSIEGLTKELQDYMGLHHGDGFTDVVRLQPLTDIYLEPPAPSDRGVRGDPWVVGAALVLALVVLLLAGINFVNITIAQFMTRTREIGIRKSLGSSRGHLFTQFMAEALVVSLGATLIGMVLVALLVSFGSSLVPVQRALPGFGLEGVIWQMVGVGVTAGVLAGAYPAFIVSRWDVVTTLKGFARGTRGSRIPVRELLLLLQFGLCSLTLTGGVAVYGQTQMMLHKDLGFRTEGVLISHFFYPQVRGNYPTLKTVLLESPAVGGVAVFRNYPARNIRGNWWEPVRFVETPDDQVRCREISIEPGYIEMFEHEILAGRSFRTDRFNPDEIILNETTVRSLGSTPEQIVGRSVLIREDASEKIVAGVVADFHFEPLKTPLGPIYFRPVDHATFLGIRVDPGVTASTLAAVHEKWNSVLPDFPLNYTMLEDEAQQNLAQEKALSDLLVVCAAIVMSIALLGVYAMTSYSSRGRAKEAAVRRALGASVGQTLLVLVRPYLKLALIAVILVMPVGLWICIQWLEVYPERIGMEWVAVAGLVATLATLLGALLASSAQALALVRQEVTAALRLE